MVQGSIDHTFTVLNKKTENYNENDFYIQWHDKRVKNHPFFKWVGENANLDSAMATMNCKQGGKTDFGRVCNYEAAQVDEYFKNAFGEESVWVCKIPKDHMVLALRFVMKLSDFKTSAKGRWSSFAGLHRFTNVQDAKNTILREGIKFYKQKKTTNLTTFKVNSEMNIIPEFIAGTLSWLFNSNIDSPFVE